LYGTDRDGMRRVFLVAWRKAGDGEPLQPLERLVAEVVAEHPEYQRYLSDADGGIGRDFPPELGDTNPFLHMGLHISIREQLSVDRPPGVAALYRRIRLRTGDAHTAEHRIMECLAQSLWEAQRAGATPDEGGYLDCLRALAGS
jgi:hypothetical protein